SLLQHRELPGAVRQDRAAQGPSPGPGAHPARRRQLARVPRAGLVHQAPRAVAHLPAARPVGSEVPRELAQPHPGGPESLDDHRLHRSGPRGERLRAGQLLGLGFRVPGAGALLHGAPQRRLLSREDATMTTRQTIGALTGALLITGCGLLDTQQPNIIDPGTLNSPAGAEALRTGAISDFAFVKDGDGTQFADGLILVGGLLSDEFVLSTTPPSEQE